MSWALLNILYCSLLLNVIPHQLSSARPGTIFSHGPCLILSRALWRMRSPWRGHVPTVTGQSTICCRHLGEDGRASLRKLSAVEGFRMNLWDLRQWKPAVFQDPEISEGLLGNILGNMWS
eukprot:9284730-Karenia_brevis.AAC.1